ncbi:MAG TPA: DUF5947 family protein [Methylocella sp.]|nr:DUF5947 family protein [Methylocella sp.]
MSIGTLPGNWVASVWRFARSRGSAVLESCELCGAPIGASHRHLAEPGKHRLLCVCGTCAALSGEDGNGLYRGVPENARRLETFHMTDAEWDALGIPVGLAFFIFSSSQKRIAAFYPGPAGTMESLLDLRDWEQIAAANPGLHSLRPDVEALLVNRVNGAREYYLAPVDLCYALAGLIRKYWRGLSGGHAAWQEIGRFFSRLRERDPRVSAGVCGHD